MTVMPPMVVFWCVVLFGLFVYACWRGAKPMTDPEARIERLLAVLKEIAESPESRDALQVLAWQTYQQESPEWVLADDPQNPHNQVPDFSKGKS